MSKPILYRLIDRNGQTYCSAIKGTIGGHSGLKIYGRLDCPSAQRYLAKGLYSRYRVFFADEATAVAAGYRPCAICMREKYLIWKNNKSR